MMYTSVDAKQVQDLLTRMKAGQVADISILAGGLANSNYRVDRVDGCFQQQLVEHHLRESPRLDLLVDVFVKLANELRHRALIEN